jgi:hypothetical protein
VSEIDFYEVVRVLDTPATRDLGVPNTVGIVLGKSKEGNITVSYAVSIDGMTYSLHDADIEPTGRKVEREEIYTGQHIFISPEGEIVGGNSHSNG